MLLVANKAIYKKRLRKFVHLLFKIFIHISKMRFCIFYVAVAIFISSLQIHAAHKSINVCHGVANNIFLPVLNNCSAYYVCMDEMPVERACRKGFLFDSKSQSCTNPSQAQCLKNCTSAFSTFRYDHTCSKYVLCYAGTPVVRQCRDGLQYNAETDRCDFPKYVDCVDDMCTIFNDSANITFLSSQAACDKYYVCVDGATFGRKCSTGLYFNPECNCCDFKSKVNCTIPVLKRTITPLSRYPPEAANDICPQDGIQFYPHTKKHKYYFCVKGHGIVMDCTPGLIYDHEMETCREKKNIFKLVM